jgi:hypothetical protein
MTKEQWAKVETALKSQFNPVNLKCDGFDVILSLSQISQFSLAIRVFVNGWLKGEWFNNDHPAEEVLRFFPVHRVNVYSAAQKKKWAKLNKKLSKEFRFNTDATIRHYGLHWTSFPALKRHFIAHNENIELIEE